MEEQQHLPEDATWPPVVFTGEPEVLYLGFHTGDQEADLKQNLITRGQLAFPLRMEEGA